MCAARARISCSCRYAVRRARVLCPPKRLISCEMTVAFPLRPPPTSPEVSSVNVVRFASRFVSRPNYDRPLPARLSSLIPMAGILLNRRLLFVDDELAELGADV
jgi:hypothetical protein